MVTRVTLSSLLSLPALSPTLVWVVDICKVMWFGDKVKYERKKETRPWSMHGHSFNNAPYSDTFSAFSSCPVNLAASAAMSFRAFLWGLGISINVASGASDRKEPSVTSKCGVAYIGVPKTRKGTEILFTFHVKTKSVKHLSLYALYSPPLRQKDTSLHAYKCSEINEGVQLCQNYL